MRALFRALGGLLPQEEDSNDEPIDIGGMRQLFFDTVEDAHHLRGYRLSRPLDVLSLDFGPELDPQFGAYYHLPNHRSANGRGELLTGLGSSYEEAQGDLVSHLIDRMEALEQQQPIEELTSQLQYQYLSSIFLK
tara:strand:+ start:638 stop:1042 length:405 start_codon:yes stop_codon:yes gene_type:complete